MRASSSVLLGLVLLLSACGGAAAPTLAGSAPLREGHQGTFGVEGVRFITPNGEEVVEVFVFVDGRRVGACDVRRMRGEACVAQTPVAPGAHGIEIGVRCRKPESLSTLGCAYTVLDRVHFERSESVTLDLERAFADPGDPSGYLTRQSKARPGVDPRHGASAALAHVAAPRSDEPADLGASDPPGSDEARR